MKIGIDCRIFSSAFTGIGRYTYELVHELLEMNKTASHPNDFVLFFNNPEFKNFHTEDPHVKKILVDAKHYSLAEQIIFLRKLNKENLDIVHFSHFNLPIFYRRPYTVTIHDLILSVFPGRKMTSWYYRLAYNLVIKHAVKSSKKIIAVSKNTKEDIKKFLHMPDKKIEVIYNGISENFKFIQDASIFQKTLSKYNIEKPFLLYTGVWRTHKNLPRLIEAFSILRKGHNLDLQLVITGKPDPFYPEVKKTVKDFGLTNDVIFTGLVNDEELVHLYNAAMIYVFPSLYEGFGFPPLEAMACGTPVAASNASSIPEVCGKENAIFFDPYNTLDVAEKIHSIYKDPELQSQLVENGFIHAQKFSWKKMATQTFNIIQESCSKNSKNS